MSQNASFEASLFFWGGNLTLNALHFIYSNTPKSTVIFHYDTTFLLSDDEKEEAAS